MSDYAEGVDALASFSDAELADFYRDDLAAEAGFVDSSASQSRPTLLDYLTGIAGVVSGFVKKDDKPKTGTAKQSTTSALPSWLLPAGLGLGGLLLLGILFLGGRKN